MSSTYVEGPTLRPGKHGIRQEGRRGRRSVSTEPSCFRQQPRTTLASILRSSCRCCVRTDAFVTGTSRTPTCPSRSADLFRQLGQRSRPLTHPPSDSFGRQQRKRGPDGSSPPGSLFSLGRPDSAPSFAAGRVDADHLDGSDKASSGSTPVPARNAPTAPAMVPVIPTAPPRCRSRTSPSRPRPRSGCLCFPGVPHRTAVCARPVASHTQKWDTRLADRGQG